MNLESKLAEVPYIVGRLQVDEGFQYGKPWGNITSLRCHHLVEEAYREAGILPAQCPLPKQGTKLKKLESFFKTKF